MPRLPRRIRSRPLAFLGRGVLLLLLSALFAVAVTALGTSGAMLTTAPAALSLTLEPLSLLLMPGVFYGVLESNILEHRYKNMPHPTSHDYSPNAVLVGSLLFYFLLALYLLIRRARRRAAGSLTHI